MRNEDSGLLAKTLTVLSNLEPNEQKATFVSTLLVFMLMASYYVLRPVRDSLASDWSDTEVSFLWNINALVSAVIVAVYGFAVSKARLRNVVPAMYGFFALSFLLFYAGVSRVEDNELADKAFYLWVSVFALFHVSVFWAFMADTFNPTQAKRTFGVIAAGASAGTLFGPAIPTLFAERMGLENLMLIASTGLLLVIPMVFYLYRLKAVELANSEHVADAPEASIGGAWWRGFDALVSNPYLLGIAAFILLYVFVGSFFYFEQKNLLAEFTRTERTRILGGVDWIVSAMTFGLAFFATGRIVSRIGMPFALALVPVLISICLVVLAFAPMLTVFLAFQVFRRGGNYGLTRPAREMLYTRVSREERFKAKPVIDIVVYRGGDAVSGSLFALLTDGLGMGLAAVGVVGAAIAAAWAAVGAWIGRVFERGGGRRRAP